MDIRTLASQKSIASRDKFIKKLKKENEDLTARNTTLKKELEFFKKQARYHEEQELMTRIELFNCAIEKPGTPSGFIEEYKTAIKTTKEKLQLLTF